MYIECRSCHSMKHEDEYPVQRKTGFRGDATTYTRRLDCRACVALAAKQYRSTHKSIPKLRIGTTADSYLISAIGCRCSDAKARANKRGLPYDLTTEYMYALYKQQHGECALTGNALSTGKGELRVLSIDQRVPSKGYVKGNVQWVTWQANRAKGDGTTQEFMQMCKDVLGRCNDYPEREYSQVAGSAQPINLG